MKKPMWCPVDDWGYPCYDSESGCCKLGSSAREECDAFDLLEEEDEEN